MIMSVLHLKPFFLNGLYGMTLAIYVWRSG